MTSHRVKIVVAKCRPQEPIHQNRRNYCADCGYPIMWTEEWGWIAARTPDPEYGVFLAPPDPPAGVVTEVASSEPLAHPGDAPAPAGRISNPPESGSDLLRYDGSDDGH